MKSIIFPVMYMIMNLSYAQVDGAYLDAPYKHLIHPIKSTIINKGASKNDVVSVIKNQSAVKSQSARGTCSIFSSTAYLESLLIKNKSFDNSIDLSEEWLEYLVVRNKGSDGSSAPANFNAFLKYGMPFEKTLPYIGEDWIKIDGDLESSRCSHVNQINNRSCLIGHWDPSYLDLPNANIPDPQFVAAKVEAFNFKRKYLANPVSDFYIYSEDEVKSLLQKGQPVILEVNFFYGAWNHSLADEMGIDRNYDHWAKGIVASPEAGSLDVQESPKHRAGHSILVVGYDDNVIVSKEIQMADGSLKKFNYKGVYYFKNSWGKGSFGADFKVAGQKFPGYGMIVQKYAEEEGSFFKLSL